MNPTLAPLGRIGLIGAGAFGRFCLGAYGSNPDIQVIAVADANRQARALIEGASFRVESDWQRVVHDPAIEVIHLATPPFDREPIVEAAFDAGKSVFCEKPAALSLPSLDRMLQRARERGKVFAVDFVMRHSPLYGLLLRLVESGVLGKPSTLSFTNLAQQVAAGHWFWDQTRSGGIFVEHGVHFFDMYGRIFGHAVSVAASSPRRELVAAEVRYANGGSGYYLHDFSYPGSVERTGAVVGFTSATIGLAGWIPMHLDGRIDADQPTLSATAASPDIDVRLGRDGDAVTLSADVSDREQLYRNSIVAGMRATVAEHRGEASADSSAAIWESLAIALAAQESVHAGAEISVPRRR